MLLKDAIDLILPYACDICGAQADADPDMPEYQKAYKEIFGEEPDFHICKKCISSLVPAPHENRWFLTLSNPYEDDPYPALALFMPFPYDGAVKTAIPKIKFGRKKGLARLFGLILAQIAQEEQIHADLIVPVPLSDERMKERGFNQAREISFPISKTLNIPFSDTVLIRTRNTGRQTECRDNNARIENVKGAFEVNPEWDIEGTTIILADDVATTGHTLHEAASTLMQSGAKDVLCLAFAGNRLVKNVEPF